MSYEKVIAEKDRRITELEAEVRRLRESDAIPGEMFREVCRQLSVRDDNMKELRKREWYLKEDETEIRVFNSNDRLIRFSKDHTDLNRFLDKLRSPNRKNSKEDGE